MAQSTCFALPPEKLASPTSKRMRFSLKFNKALTQESLLTSGYCEPKHEPVATCIEESSDCYVVQDENASPNCSFTQPKQPLEIVSESDDQTVLPSVLGLPNCGNTCYVNSILQVLRYTPNFTDYINLIVSYQTFLTKISGSSDVQEAKFFTKLRELYTAMRKQEAILSKNTDHSTLLVRPVKSFLSSLRDMSCMFEEGEQHDAHELFLMIISTFSSASQNVRASILAYNNVNNFNQVMDCSANMDANMEISEEPLADTVCTPIKEPKRTKYQTKRLQKSNYIRNKAERISKGLNDMNLGFEGTLRHIIQCLECEKKLERLELFMNLEVSIPDDLVNEDTVELIECLTQRNVLSGENKYFCEDCYHLNEAEMLSQIVKLPSVLLLHCSWKKQSSNITDIEKDYMKILIPMFMNTSGNTAVFDCNDDQIYQLYAIVLHLGNSTEVGHYVSFIKEVFSVSETSKIHNINESNFNKDFHCENDDIVKPLNTPVSRWLLFDDENVSSICVNESSGIFPYYEFLGITASPCMIFYCKYDTTTFNM